MINIGIIVSPAPLNTPLIENMVLKIIYEELTMIRYSTPILITFGSFVNKLIKGKRNASTIAVIVIDMIADMPSVARSPDLTLCVLFAPIFWPN